MKSKLLSTFSMLRVIMVAALAVFCVSCDKTETTDSTGFILHYLGVTDIGPSMSYTLKAPTYKGSAPYDFTITNVTLNDETYNNEDNFVINAETGEITIQNTETMSAGLYNISVGCYSNGNFYNFKNAVQVNMLLAVPEGVTVEPAEVLVNQDEENWIEASAQVTTEKDKHVSITNYAIAQDESKPYLEYFSINNEGKITIKSGTTEQQLIAGESYTLSLKLTTKAGEHMYTDAVTFKVVSKPRNLFYIEQEFLPDLFEVQVEGKSVIPTIEGSKEGLKFAIKSVTPETSAFIIDETTGQISLPENHPLTESETPYVFTITVENTYGSSDFEAVYSAKIVAFIEPIQPETFHYTAVDKLYQQGGSLENQLPDQGFIGGAPTFQFDESNSDEIKTQIAQNIISINSGTGAISIANNHTLTAKTHEIQVRVTNKKNEEGVIKALAVTVVENPNDFEYVSWGTNLEHPFEFTGTELPLTQTKGNIHNRNQFRFINTAMQNNGQSTVLSLMESDLPNEGVSYDVNYEKCVPNGKFTSTQIDNDGSITLFKSDFLSDGEGGVLFIKVTVQISPEIPAITKNIPIFFSTPQKAKDNRVLIFNPFVIKANPKTGICSTTECKVVGWNNRKITSEGELDIKDLVLDYRKEFSYYNFDNNQNHGSGLLSQTSQPTEFLYQVWDNCGFTGPSNKGSRLPMAIHMDGGAQAGYIDPQTFQLKITPNNIWIGNDNKYPFGIMIGKIKYNLVNDIQGIHDSPLDSSKPSYEVFPLIIWFDETYEGN